MNIIDLVGLYNPEDMEVRTITTGELSNFIGNEIAILKVIGVETEYQDSRLFSEDIEARREALRELETYNIKEYNGTPIAETTIYIKVLKTGKNRKGTFYLKLVEILDLNHLEFDSSIYETLIRDSIIKKGLKYSRKRPKLYYLDTDKYRNGRGVTNRFSDLLGVEFLVTGLGVKIDERANSLDNLIILDGVLSDYRFK